MCWQSRCYRLCIVLNRRCKWKLIVLFCLDLLAAAAAQSNRAFRSLVHAVSTSLFLSKQAQKEFNSAAQSPTLRPRLALGFTLKGRSLFEDPIRSDTANFTGRWPVLKV